ncbi:MAG: glycosyltransferase family 4 protein, partial [candidate division Zixibacteria bacterium]|nr:glycosyltransferase family 4 protein [candidate division Zixibacteria bacterium]
MKLLMLTHNYPRYNGDFAGVFISLLAKNLPAHNIEPVVLAPHDSDAAELEEVDGVTIYRFRYADTDEGEDIAYRGNMHQRVLKSPSGIFRFKHFLDSFRKAALDIIEKEQIQVVAGHWLVPAGIVMKTIKKKTSLPMILSSHGTDVNLMRKYDGVIYRYLKGFCRSLYRWTVVSSYLRKTILETDSKLEPIMEILPLPHDEEMFYRDKAIKRDSNLVVAVTRFTEQKRVDYLIKAFALVIEKNQTARLELYGGGPLENKIKDLIDNFGLQDRVTIHNAVPQEQLREIYNRAAVVVLNSYQEGFGLALSEAMMCEAAVIGTDSGGIPDIITHNETGLLVAVDNKTVLAESVIRLLGDEGLRTGLAKAGHNYAHQIYASDPLSRRYAEIVKAAVD